MHTFKIIDQSAGNTPNTLILANRPRSDKISDYKMVSILDRNGKRLCTNKSHDLGISTSNIMLFTLFGSKFYSSNNMGEIGCLVH